VFVILAPDYFPFAVKAIIWERRIFQFLIAATCVWFIHFCLEFVCFLCSSFSLSTFHPQVFACIL